MKNKPLVIIISGPSQVGKDTIVTQLYKQKSLNFKKAVTYTTRKKRPEEREGRDHFYITTKKFLSLIKQDFFIEWAPVRDKLFGTSFKSIQEILAEHKNVLLKIDVRGARQVRKKIINVKSIFILPESLESIIIRMKRKGFKGADFKTRLREAKHEIAEAKKYDFQVVNYDDQLAKTVKQVALIIKLLTKGIEIVKIKKKLNY